MKNKILSNSIIYTACGLLLKCFSFFLLPLYTAYLTTEDYGMTSVSSSFISTMSFVVAFSLFSAVLRFYVDLKNDPEQLRRFYGTIICFVFASGSIFAVIFVVIKDFLSQYVFSGANFYPVILITIISLIFSCQHTVYENILRSQQRAIKYAVTAIVYFILNLILNIYFVVALRMGGVGVILATLISNTLYTIFFIFDLVRSKSIKFCLDWNLLKSALKYSVPIMPHNLSTSITVLISKILIGGKSSLATLGLYSVASQFGHIADTVQVYVNNAYGPWLYEKLHDKEEEYKKSINNIVKMLSDIIGVFLIGIALFSQDYILLFLEESYSGSWKYVPFIVMVYAIKIAYYFYVNILFYYKEASRKLFIATLSGSLLNLLLSYIFIPIMGVYGSILADAVAMVVRVGIIILISRKFEDTGIRLSSFFSNFLKIAVFILGGLVLSYLKFDDSFSVFNFFYKVIFIVIYMLIILIKNKGELLNFVKAIEEKRKRG